MKSEVSGIPLIGEADICIVKGTIKAVQYACKMAKRGKKVILAVKEIYLGEDYNGSFRYELSKDIQEKFPGKVKKNGFLQPDAFKVFLEEECIACGVQLIYGVSLLDVQKNEEKNHPCSKTLLVAGKGGIFRILCNQILDQKQQIKSPFSYTMLVGNLSENESGILYEDEEKKLSFNGEMGLLTVACTEHRLVEGWKQGEKAFKELKLRFPDMELGRFAEKIADKIWGELYEVDGDMLEKSDGRKISVQSGQGFLEHGGVFKTEVRADKEVYDIVIVGGGTSGAMAAIYAARGGARTVLIEPQYTLGGTSTVGGVSTYWFGNRYSDVKEIDRRTEEIEKSLFVKKRPGIWAESDDFHPSIRGQVLTELCAEAGVTVCFGTLCFGALLDEEKENTCCGVVAVGDNGITAYYGKMVIDATGDGDAAVFAGADATYGSTEDCITYWASLAQYTGIRRYRNNFASMVVAPDPEDATRFILLGRKRGEKIFDHGSYLSMRESRHVRGKYTVDLKDLMSFRTYEDRLYTCYSNYDPKGKLDADAIYCGFLPPQAQIQIPLSALLPCDRKGKQIKGIYVAGKAISVTHNAFPSVRMQPDLMHQGAVLGGLLAECVKGNCYPEDIDCKKRIELLHKITDDPLELPKGEKSLKEYVEKLDKDSRTHWVDVPFTYMEKRMEESLAIITADAKEVLPLLQEKLRKTDLISEKQTRIAIIGYCMWHGNYADLEEFQSALISQMSKEGLSKRKDSVMCAQLLPDHGVMPETVYKMNLLGTSGDKRILPVFEYVLTLLLKEKRDYYDIRKGIYHYIESFAYAAGYGNHKEWIPMLKTLLNFPEFQELEQEKKQVELLTERLLILKFILYRALYRLGDSEGRKGLETMRKSNIKAISMSADKALRKSGQRHHKGEKIW